MANGRSETIGERAAFDAIAPSARPSRARQRLARALRLAVGLAFALALVALLFKGLLFGVEPGAGSAQAAYDAQPVGLGTLREEVVATGTLAPYATVVVQSEIPGVVSKVLVDDGDRIQRGEPIVELDRRRLENVVAELRARLKAREAMAAIDLAGKASAELSQTRAELARVQHLHERGVASERAVQDARYAAQLAEIALSGARSQATAHDAEAEETRNALRQREDDLAKSVVRAPIDAVVLHRAVEVGTAVADLINGATVIATLADDREIHLRADVDEHDVVRLRLDGPAEVRIDAMPDETFAGRVRKISSAGSSEGSVASFQVEIAIAPDPRIRVGMSADARILVREHAQVLLVPNRAIVRTEQGPMVRRPSAAAAGFDLVPIREAYSDGFQTIVTEGVTQGDVVLVQVPPAPSES